MPESPPQRSRSRDRGDSPPVHPSRREVVPRTKGSERSRSPRRREYGSDSRDGYRGGSSEVGRRDSHRGRDRDRDRERDFRDRDHERDRNRTRDREGERGGSFNRPRRGGGGFKFKEKRRDDDERQDDRDRRGLERGYRDSPRRDERRDRDRESKAPPPPPAARKPAVAPMGGGEEMIVVHVNDRLGTKAAIPCLASDTVRQFKMMVAARIGRETHEILLKRQGERPFKDQLTLDDYGVSNGVQLDLEVDAGD
jgi:hypothetical protein